ncbi:hypothetical protein F6X40_23840 [Paraburkholderia sp. UCT31]|uniref:hypothetical protein n=1 Tax=Paraburkholderia sp. UCT31 TaxID=2615209 RepID=UPI0016554172|nr:hypothetical protein [Paraburkholderia sp. UCT31]MBC8739749.1 hypothetical protein [Paraburkholderia sp. UCT31]
MSKPVNPDSHFWLYAKYHYARSDNLIDDLKRLVAHRCFGDPNNGRATERDVFEVMLGIVMKHLVQQVTDRFIEMDGATPASVDGGQPQQAKRGQESEELAFHVKRLFQSIDAREEVAYRERTIKVFLSYLSFATVFGQDGRAVIPLDEPDPAILPVTVKSASTLEPVAQGF